MKKLLIFTVVLFLGVAGAPGWGQSFAENSAPPEGEEAFVDPFEQEDPFDDKNEEVRIADPLEKVNRGIFWFNDKLYFYFLKPVARAYRIVPEPGRVAINRFFSNLNTPPRFANALLQLKVEVAATELGRFMLNTTLGLGGFFDPAKESGINKKEEDFGQTLGYYGLGHGCYLVLPFLGSSSLRDGAGYAVDRFFDPLTYLLNHWQKLGATSVETINKVSLDKETYESIKKESLDPYLFIRTAYAQWREGLIKK